MKSDSKDTEIRSPRLRARLKSSKLDKLNDTPVDLENLPRKLLLLPLENLRPPELVQFTVMVMPKSHERPRSTRMMTMTKLSSLRHLKRRIWPTKSRLPMPMSSTRPWRSLLEVKMLPLYVESLEAV